MRVLYVSHSFPPPGDPLSNLGGMQRLAVDLRRALAAHPEITLTGKLLETPWEATTRRMVPFMAGLLLDLPRIVRRERIDVVLFSSLVTASVALPLRRPLHALGARLAAVAIGRDVVLPSAAYQALVRRVLRSLDRVLPISRATAAACLERGLPAERMRVVPCGVDPGRFPLRNDREAARRELLRLLSRTGPALPADPLLLSSVGRHQERKGFHWFVGEVVPRLPGNVLYLLAGDGPMTDEVRRRIEAHDLHGRVRLLGRLSEADLARLYCGSDLFAMPNLPVPGDIEGFGVVTLEAAVCGLPVVAADLEGLRDAVEEGRNGHRIPAGDAAAFAEVVSRYARDRRSLEAASRRAAEFTAGRFAWSAVGQRHFEALRASSEWPDFSSEPAWNS